jgi:hypothetical protein
MSDLSWVRSPVGTADQHWATRLGGKSVLVLVPHIEAGTRLFDLLPLLEADHRVQAVFSVPEPWESWPATHEFLTTQGGVVLPWAQARRGCYDLVLAASTRGIDEVTGPKLLIPHGGGFGQYRPWHPPDTTAREWRPLVGLDADQLMREGQLRADAIALVHDRERDLLEQTCPRALPAAVVTGDIALDRLTASLPHRQHYRRALGVGDEHRLVVVTSTWSGRSAFGRHPDLFERVLAGLPRERYRVVAALHPQIWSHHSVWQVRSWLADSLRQGLLLLPPDEGWRATLVAADYLLGDYGSVTGYAASAGVPVLLAGNDDTPLLPGTPTATLARLAPRWRPGQPLVAQLHAAAAARDATELPRVMSKLLTSRPGVSAAVLRHTMYRLLGLTEPPRPAHAAPVPLPSPIATTTPVPS